ncbi:MAG: Cof-type HAD-IIB family hydrolase [Actinobacteria bacterium]|nr:Cof-type HAD-IIB family hydrolase [Cyanobacteriota bacterium]MCL6086935.1 Cof-type HAD-IIB family hydrolase [Actinomycetota bacterium]
MAANSLEKSKESKELKKIELIAIDLDGTLFNSKSEISKRNKDAINRCLENKIKIIITTAKTVNWAKKLIKELNLKDPQIASAGAVIVNPDGDLNYIKKIPINSYKKIINLARKWEVGVAVSCIDSFVYYEKDNPFLKYVWDSGEIPGKTDNLLKNGIANQALLITITITAEHPFNNIVAEELGDELKVRRAGEYFLTAYNKRAGKLGALRNVLKITGVNPASIMAIGDSEGDLGMISLAGIGIAMGNALKKLKDAADFVVSDNDNDGVAEAINKFVFGEI